MRALPGCGLWASAGEHGEHDGSASPAWTRICCCCCWVLCSEHDQICKPMRGGTSTPIIFCVARIICAMQITILTVGNLTRKFTTAAFTSWQLFSTCVFVVVVDFSEASKARVLENPFFCGVSPDSFHTIQFPEPANPVCWTTSLWF